MNFMDLRRGAEVFGGARPRAMSDEIWREYDRCPWQSLAKYISGEDTLGPFRASIRHVINDVMSTAPVIDLIMELASAHRVVPAFEKMGFKLVQARYQIYLTNSPFTPVQFTQFTDHLENVLTLPRLVVACCSYPLGIRCFVAKIRKRPGNQPKDDLICHAACRYYGRKFVAIDMRQRWDNLLIYSLWLNLPNRLMPS